MHYEPQNVIEFNETEKNLLEIHFENCNLDPQHVLHAIAKLVV